MASRVPEENSSSIVWTSEPFTAGRRTVGPNTVARFCRDILFSVSFSATLCTQSSNHIDWVWCLTQYWIGHFGEALPANLWAINEDSTQLNSTGNYGCRCQTPLSPYQYLRVKFWKHYHFLTSSDRFPRAVRWAEKWNLTAWCDQNLSNRALNALSVLALTTEFGKTKHNESKIGF